MSLGVKYVADQLFLEVRHAKEEHGRCERVFIFINLKLWNYYQVRFVCES